ncbi:MAG TPA: hypothetical protein VNZ47_11805 [Candidatus Dormibacteraeota bacterium]|jgi:hypothetical protein|nr:hypothetical protein [Candidatus Dormibacteraeota bacterium]
MALTGSEIVLVTPITPGGSPAATQKQATTQEIANLGGGGGITQLTGAVTAGPGSGSQAATIPNASLTYAKIQNVGASKLLGNPTGAPAAPSEITLGSNLSLAGSTLNAAGGGSLSITDGTHTVAGTTSLTVTGGTVGGTSPNATLTISGGGAPTFTLTASGNIAAGSAVSVNAAGAGVQAWGPAPSLSNTVTLINSPTAPGQVSSGPLCIKLDANDFVVFFPFLAATTPQGVAVSASISGSVITAGTPNTDASFLTIIDAAALSATSFIYSYTSGADIKIRVGTISGGVISLGTAVTITGGYPSAASQSSFAILSATTFVLAYNIGSQSWAVAGTISGSTITLGTAVGTGTLPAAQVGLTPIALSSSLVAFGTQDSTAIGLYAATVSGNTMTFGSKTDMGTTVGSTNFTMAKLSATSFIVGWLNITNNTYQTDAAVATVSGTTITAGTQAVIGPIGALPYFAVLSATAFASVQGWTQPTICTVSGTTITATFGKPIAGTFTGSGSLPPQQYFNVTYGMPPIAAVDATHFVWEDAEWNVFEEDTSGNISPPIIHPGVWSYGLFPIDGSRALAVLWMFDATVQARVINIYTINASGPIGVTAAGATNGNPVTLQNAGAITGLSGLTAGSQYYSNGDGTLTTTNTGHPVGTALSATAMAVNIQNQ